MSASDHLITTMEQLQALYGEKNPAAVVKEIDYINGSYRKLIEAAPFVAVATRRRRGSTARRRAIRAASCTSSTTRRSPFPTGRATTASTASATSCATRASRCCFSFPASARRLRVNGRASITVDPELMQSFAVNGKLPRCVLLVHVETIFFHCSKAIVRSKLWDEATKIERSSLPSTGTIIAELSQGRLGGEPYDSAMPERIKAQLY